MSPEFRKRLLAVAATGIVAVTTIYSVSEQDRIDANAINIARTIGSYYESSGRHIGMPYLDRAGRGQPWTVCAGVTGPMVIPGKYYSPEDCERLEIPIYQNQLQLAKRQLREWRTYNAFVRASFIDVAYNVPSALTTDSTMKRKANAGDLVGACMEMPRWNKGTINNRLTVLPGLVDRRATTAELCAEWRKLGDIKP